MDLIKDILGENVGQVVMIMIFLNAGVSSVVFFLDQIKDKTENKLDNKIADYASAALGWLRKLLDFVRGNEQPPKEPKA